MSVVHDRNGEVKGWAIKATHCTNPDCKREIVEGRLFHAIPRFGTLPDYHFNTLEEAIEAIQSHDNRDHH